MTVKIECVLECDNHLGEGPVWDVEEGRLYWVDGTGRRVGSPVPVVMPAAIRTWRAAGAQHRPAMRGITGTPAAPAPRGRCP